MNKNTNNAIEIFGDFTDKFIISSDVDHLNIGDEITLVNANCEFEFDNIKCCFENNLLYYYIVDLELLEADYSEYRIDKSNNGGCYAFATCKVTKVYEKTY